MFESIAFYIISTFTIGFFLVTVFSKNVLYAMTSLAAGMSLISGYFFMLGADFLGVVQLIVYVGAVMALYAFGMMFFDVTRDIKEKNTSTSVVLVIAGSIAVMLTLVFIMPIDNNSVMTFVQPEANATNPEAVGIVLFTKYLVPFEVAAIMLLVAMIGGIILAGKKMDNSLTSTEDDKIIDTEGVK